MRLELIIIIITIFFMINTYHDGKYLQLLKSCKKYYQIIFYGIIGLSILIFIRKNPNDGYNLFKSANKMIKYMPIDRDSVDLLTPMLDMSSHFSKSTTNNNIVESPGYQRMINSGSKTTKRSVSETKKKFVASNQNWQCAHCKIKLPAWFEVDHKVRLEHGGDNHINNLEALCRDCHGKKTSLESMI